MTTCYITWDFTALYHPSYAHILPGWQGLCVQLLRYLLQYCTVPSHVCTDLARLPSDLCARDLDGAILRELERLRQDIVLNEGVLVKLLQSQVTSHK